MQAVSDLIIERRRLRRRLAFWRIAAIVAVVVAVVVAVPKPDLAAGPHVARVTIDGIILDDPERDAMIAALAEDEAVRAVVVRISSPGGTVVGSEALFDALRLVAAEKPVVAVIGEVGASGAYMAAAAADRIFARGNTITGSVGVIAEIPNVAGLLEMAGIEVTRVRSSPLKAEPGLTEAPSPEGLAIEQELIDEAHAWFRGLVGERRGLEGAALDAVTTGRVFSGRQAVLNGLIDAIGDETAALDWLAAERGIDPELEVENYLWGDEEEPWPYSILGRIGGFLERGAAALPAGPRLYAMMR